MAMQWLLEAVLVVLLTATLWHAIRLERALGVLKRDRAALRDLIAGFNDSTRQAEAAIERLRGAADGTGRQIARQLEAALTLKDDLGFLVERGEQLADRLEIAVRAARARLPDARPDIGRPEPARPGPAHTDAARIERPRAEPRRAPEPALADAAPLPRARSEAERELMRALRMAR